MIGKRILGKRMIGKKSRMVWHVGLSGGLLKGFIILLFCGSIPDPTFFKKG